MVMKAPAASFLPSWHYPVVIAVAFALFAFLQYEGVSLVLSTYVPVLLTAALVTLLELRYPHRTEWQPPAGEVRTDLVFMAVVQLAFPPMVAFLFTYALIAPARALNLPVATLWPHGWPIWVQAVLMVLVVDFLRYWLHRAAHRQRHALAAAFGSSLRRAALLAEHGAVPSAREGASDGARQPSVPADAGRCDSALALLHRLRDQRLLPALQHPVALRRPLNYIVGSAETHRWHHSRVPRESNANYGNTVIVWDLVFGTWFLPREREIKDLGLQDPAYPKSFLVLMRAPFSR